MIFGLGFCPVLYTLERRKTTFPLLNHCLGYGFETRQTHSSTHDRRAFIVYFILMFLEHNTVALTNPSFSCLDAQLLSTLFKCSASCIILQQATLFPKGLHLRFVLTITQRWVDPTESCILCHTYLLNDRPEPLFKPLRQDSFHSFDTWSKHYTVQSHCAKCLEMLA